MDKLIKRWPVIIGLILIVSTFYFFSNIWLYIILAAVISLIGRPLVQLLIKIKIKKFSISKSLAAGLSLFTFWAALYLFLSVFVPLIVNEANELSKINTVAIQNHFHEPISNLQCTLENIVIEKDDFDLKAYVEEKLTTVLNLSQVKSFFSNIVGTVGDIFIAIFAISFISFFFLKDNKLLMRGILSLVSARKEEQVKHAILKIIKLLSRYFMGLMMEVTAIIILVTLGLWAVGIAFQHAIVIGLVAGFLNVIPYVGPLIGMAFGSVIAIATELTGEIPDNLLILFIAVISVFLIVQLIDNFVLQPFIYSNSVNASPLEIFIVILMAGTVGGIGGMILAIPIYTILRVIAKETLSQFKFVKQLTEDI
jgi:predicted PurR-regulated permease PerM